MYEKMNEDNKILELSMKNIDAYFDLYDKACMFLVKIVGINYLQAFLRVYNDIKNNEINSSKLSQKEVEELQDMEDAIMDSYFLNEEIRKALVLLLVTAFKHVKSSLDLMTPDFISYLFTFIINALFEKEIKKEKMNKISILDVNLGTSNLINLISNNLSFESELLGIEINNEYALISEAFSSLQGNSVSIYNNSCLDYMTLSANVIIGDLDCKEEDGKYLPYEIILKYQHTNVDKSFMIFLVDNDFFNKPQIEEFKKGFKGSIIGLIALSESLFKKQAKSILIISPKKYKSLDALAINLPSEKEEQKHLEALYNIRKWLNKF